METETMNVNDLVEDLHKAQEWMRWPDWGNKVTSSNIAVWINRRPTSVMPRAATALTALKSHVENADATITELRREVNRLREALQPFSAFAGVVFERNFNNDDPVDTMTASDGQRRHLYARDFFAVRAALSTSHQGGELNGYCV